MTRRKGNAEITSEKCVFAFKVSNVTLESVLEPLSIAFRNRKLMAWIALLLVWRLAGVDLHVAQGAAAMDAN